MQEVDIKLGELLTGHLEAELTGDSDVEIDDIAYDSRQVMPNSLFVAITGLLICWFVYDRLALAPPIMPGHPLLLLVVGVVFGVVLAYSLIEARSLWLLFPMMIILAGLWLWFWRRSALPIRKYLTERPFTTFVAILVIATLVLTIGYGLIYGGFPQPSEMFLADLKKS